MDLRGKDWASQVRRATEATYLFHTGGSCLNLRCVDTHKAVVCVLQVALWSAALTPVSVGNVLSSEGHNPLRAFSSTTAVG